MVVYRRVAVLTCITCMFTVNELIAYKQVAVFVTCMFTVSKSDCLQATTRIQLWLRPTSPSCSLQSASLITRSISNSLKRSKFGANETTAMNSKTTRSVHRDRLKIHFLSSILIGKCLLKKFLANPFVFYIFDIIVWIIAYMLFKIQH